MPTYTGPGTAELVSGDPVAMQSNPDKIIQGIKMELTHPSGGRWNLEDWGYAGEAEDSLPALDLSILVNPTKVSRDVLDIAVFVIDGERNLLHLPETKLQHGESRYSQRINIIRKGKWFTASSQNSHVMISALDRRGRVTVYAADLIIQRNKMFLIKQLVRQSQAFVAEDGRVVIPDFIGEHTRWVQLQEYSVPIFAERLDIQKLPAIADYKPETLDLADLEEGQMVTNLFSTARRQIAGGTLKDGRVARVHYLALEPDDPNPHRPRIIPQWAMLKVLDLQPVPEGKSTFRWEVKKAQLVS